MNVRVNDGIGPGYNPYKSPQNRLLTDPGMLFDESIPVLVPMYIRVSQISIFLKFQYVEDGIHEQT